MKRSPNQPICWDLVLAKTICRAIIVVSFTLSIVILAYASKTSPTKHFKLSEFACHHCGQSKINIELINKLEDLRQVLGRPIIVTSGYRCPLHNAQCGGAKKSQHLYGNAVDIKVKGYTPREVANVAKICGFTWTKTYRSWTHIDIRQTQLARAK